MASEWHWKSVAATAIISGMTITGCGGAQPVLAPLELPNAAGTTSPTPVTTTAAAAAGFDYRILLLQPEDMVRPNAGYSVPQPATLNPQGVIGAEVMITADDSTNAVGITISLLPDASTAPAELPKAVANLSTVTSGEAPTPIPVGDEAVAITGTTPDGTEAATALMFRQGRAIVRIDFYSLPDNPTPVDVVIDIGQKQAAVLRVGLAAIDR